MNSPYSTDEQETTINVFPKSMSEQAEIFTCIPATIRQLQKLYKEHPDDVTVIENDGYVNATVPRDWIKIQPKRKCTLTDEQKRANAERLASLRRAKEAVENDAT